MGLMQSGKDNDNKDDNLWFLPDDAYEFTLKDVKVGDGDDGEPAYELTYEIQVDYEAVGAPSPLHVPAIKQVWQTANMQQRKVLYALIGTPVARNPADPDSPIEWKGGLFAWNGETGEKFKSVGKGQLILECSKKPAHKKDGSGTWAATYKVRDIDKPGTFATKAEKSRAAARKLAAATMPEPSMEEGAKPEGTPAAPRRRTGVK